MKEFKTIYVPGFPSALMEFQKMVKDGWEIDEDNYPNADFVGYQISLVREEQRKEVLEAFTGDSKDVVKRGRKSN